MKRDVNEPMHRRGPSLYKPSTYCLHVAFLVAQENQAPGPRKNRLRGASNRLTRDSLVRPPLSSGRLNACHGAVDRI